MTNTTNPAKTEFTITDMLLEYEEKATTIMEGLLPDKEVYEIAFTVIAYAAKLAGGFDISQRDALSSKEALETLKQVESGREYLHSIAPLFVKYPLITATIQNLLKTMAYAEATLVPFYCLPSTKTTRKGDAFTRTYIVKHPLTGFIKIGRTVDVDSRIKSLQTGAGAALTLIAVLNGDYELELHRRFSCHRKYGEWFDDSDGTIVAFVEELETKLRT